MTRTAVLYISDYQSDEVSGPAAITRQQIICTQTINTRGWRLIKEYIDDTVIDKNATPIKLFEAIDYCQANESILVFAELNLWAHNIGFTSKVLSSEIDVYFCDMPFVDAKILEILARVAQYERGLISRRTKAALAAKKQRGERWNIEANMEAISKAARVRAPHAGSERCTIQLTYSFGGSFRTGRPGTERSRRTRILHLLPTSCGRWVRPRPRGWSTRPTGRGPCM